LTTGIAPILLVVSKVAADLIVSSGRQVISMA